MFANILPLVLLSWPTPPPVSPNVDLPDDLEVCILKAEVCVLHLDVVACGESDSLDRGLHCVGPFEDCSHLIPESNDPACRIDYVWCKLEADASVWPAEWMAYCEDVYAACPTLW